MSKVITEPTVVNCKQCGQETVIEFYPNQTEKSKRARAKKALCFECYKKQKAGGAAEYNRRRGYSKLRGSTKQIDWAESLRKIHIFRIVNHLEVVGQKQFAHRTEKYLGSKTSAKWWVEHSEYSTIEKHIEELIHNATTKVS